MAESSESPTAFPDVIGLCKFGNTTMVVFPHSLLIVSQNFPSCAPGFILSSMQLISPTLYVTLWPSIQLRTYGVLSVQICVVFSPRNPWLILLTRIQIFTTPIFQKTNNP
jgi:hypothetical protein